MVSQCDIGKAYCPHADPLQKVIVESWVQCPDGAHSGHYGETEDTQCGHGHTPNLERTHCVMAPPISAALIAAKPS
jgi:hypothetical protein